MVFEGEKVLTLLRQVGAHLGVTRQGGGLIVVVGEHRLDAQLLGQLADFIGRHTVQHPQARVWVLAARPNLLVQLLEALPDEFDTPVSTWQLRQEDGVKNKHQMHLLAARQGLGQAGVVVEAQVTAEPKQATGKFRLKFRMQRGVHVE